MTKSCFSILCFLLFLFNPLFSQDFTPVIKQFSKNDYAASNQNWSVAQSQDGMMYFGNNVGLLQFDGSDWSVYRIPGNKIVRTVFAGTDNRLYTGSFEEFGFFEKKSDGTLSYESLSAKLTDYSMMNDEIWTINQWKDTVVFQSFTSYFIYAGGKVTGHRMPATFLFFHRFDNQLFSHTQQSGYSRINLKSHKILPVLTPANPGEVINCLPVHSGKGILATKSQGLFSFDGKKITPFPTNADELLKKAEVNKAVMNTNGTILLGTIREGLIALDSRGKLLWKLNRENGLQNNTVLGMLIDRDGNLWLTLDKGIAYIRLNSGIRYLSSFQPPIGAVYDAAVKDNRLFLATNQGLYEADCNLPDGSVGKPQPAGNISGQVWTLDVFDNQLFCGNNNGTVSADKAFTRISPVQGGMVMRKGIIQGQEVIIQGTYTDLCVYTKSGQQWNFSHRIDNFVNPVRYLEIDYTGIIWASHLHKGLYAIKLSTDLKKIAKKEEYQSLDGKSASNINVFSINNRVVFTDHTRFYTYDDLHHTIIPYHSLNKSLGYYATAYRVIQYRPGYYWFIRDDAAALFEVKEDKATLVDVIYYAIFRNQTVDDYQNIIPLDDNSCLLTLENGLALYRSGREDIVNNKNKLTLKELMTTDGLAQQSHYLDLNPEKRSGISYRQNNLRFSVYYPDFKSMDNLLYSFRLEGLEQVWSEPVSSGTKLYNYLPAGSYVFHARVQTPGGQVIDELSYPFVVYPPFYWSWPARLIYLLLMMLAVYLLILIMRKRYQQKHEEMQQHQEELRKQEIEKREQQIMRLEKDKLEAELVLKSKELAGSTMTIIRKNEILIRIREEIDKQKEALGTQYPKKYYDKVMKIIEESMTSEDDWNIFQANFDRIHENFFRHLHRDYPELTSNDLRFCAYLRLNLSSKDIAHLMNISLKGVEVARYRIRKKINLPSEKSLTEFMIEFT